MPVVATLQHTLMPLVSHDDSKTDERRIDALAEKVAHLLLLDDESWRYDGRAFLKTVLNDYMYLTQIDQ